MKNKYCLGLIILAASFIHICGLSEARICPPIGNGEGVITGVKNTPGGSTGCNVKRDEDTKKFKTEHIKTKPSSLGVDKISTKTDEQMVLIKHLKDKTGGTVDLLKPKSDQKNGDTEKSKTGTKPIKKPEIKVKKPEVKVKPPKKPKCPEGYVPEKKTGKCVSPFDENYNSRNQLLASDDKDRKRETTEQKFVDESVDPNEGKSTSDQLDEEIKRTQESISAECGPQKPCSDPDNYVCFKGKCVKRQDDEKDGSTPGPPGEKPPESKPPEDQHECSESKPCPDKSYDCKNGKCVKKAIKITLKGAWNGKMKATANWGKRGGNSCPWGGSMVLTLHPNGKVTGTISGGGYAEWNDKGEFLKCSDYKSDGQFTGSHSKGSFSATSGAGSRIKGTYAEKKVGEELKFSATGSITRSGTIQASGGLGTASFNASARFNLSN